MSASNFGLTKSSMAKLKGGLSQTFSEQAIPSSSLTVASEPTVGIARLPESLIL
jgi:hypothetical protein